MKELCAGRNGLGSQICIVVKLPYSWECRTLPSPPLLNSRCAANVWPVWHHWVFGRMRYRLLCAPFRCTINNPRGILLTVIHTNVPSAATRPNISHPENEMTRDQFRYKHTSVRVAVEIYQNLWNAVTQRDWIDREDNSHPKTKSGARELLNHEARRLISTVSWRLQGYIQYQT